MAYFYKSLSVLGRWFVGLFKANESPKRKHVDEDENINGKRFKVVNGNEADKGHVENINESCGISEGSEVINDQTDMPAPSSRRQKSLSKSPQRKFYRTRSRSRPISKDIHKSKKSSTKKDNGIVENTNKCNGKLEAEAAKDQGSQNGMPPPRSGRRSSTRVRVVSKQITRSFSKSKDNYRSSSRKGPISRSRANKQSGK